MLLTDLGTIVKNEIYSTLSGSKLVFDKMTEPTQVQQKALTVPYAAVENK